MKIGIDARMIEHSGIGVRLFHICKYFAAHPVPGREIYLFGDPEKLSQYRELKDFPVIPYLKKIYSPGEMLGHPEMKYMAILDVPHFNVPLPYIQKCLVTIHDLTPFVMKEFFPGLSKRIYLQAILRWVKKAKKILTVSQFTKNDLMKYFHYPEQQIEVSYNGLDTELFYPRDSKEVIEFQKEYNLQPPYYLAVGIGKGHKNFQFLLKALKSLWIEEQTQTPLLIAGTGGVLPEFLETQILGFEKYIHVLPRIPYEKLPFVYAGAEALLFPSLYEGFGFPLIEAQGVGCPVVSSRSSVMPEILNDSALFFNPYDIKSFHTSWKELNYVKYRLIEKGYRNAGRFSWETTCKRISEIYTELETKA
ncbi:MAG: glycosyltransferase family 4 protein [Leptospiraceae bacterium]|nr:glycosyltransferase family 4 protein [Leptospiraceae bacterium]MCP5512512.1 glycosyltransferase family 4 protein [Leptospiraceae bacterium]